MTWSCCQAVRDFPAATGASRRQALAAASGTTKDAINYLVMVNETAGEVWLTPELFRFGASSLLNDLLMQRHKLATGRYAGPDYVTGGLTMAFEYAPAPESRSDIARLRASYGLFIDGEFVEPGRR